MDSPVVTQLLQGSKKMGNGFSISKLIYLGPETVIKNLYPIFATFLYCGVFSTEPV